MGTAAASFEDIEQKPVKEFTEKAYLDYAMYVILDRALPHIADGLKPVQRRIVYAMSELGLDAGSKYKKSARTVGDVLGKFHPHGDTACYEAMLLMSQSFSYRYPLIDGQGNWGSQDDPKSFAAMRYTEARLSRYAEALLQEIALGTVEWRPNFDGTLEEPTLLPARLPNILLNGGSGIAVGMATDIPSHNIREVVAGCIRLLERPQTTLEELLTLIPAPDFPTAAEIITSPQEIREIYRTGNGTIKTRAVYVEEDGEIVITALPHQVSGAKVLEQIAQQMQDKKLPQVADLRDESDHENPTRLVIVPRSNRVDVNELMLHLFATTDLEKNVRVNFNMIGVNGRPETKNLHQILSEWLVYRTETVRKRLNYRLEKIEARLHILAGLLIAFLNIDEVIAIIRREDKPKPVLMQRFQLSEIQAEAILELKLRHLAKLEEIKIRAEEEALSEERRGIVKVLGSEKEMKKLITRELTQDAEKYGDARLSPLVARQEAQIIKTEERLVSEPMTVVLSEKGWVRAAKGHEIEADKLNYKAGDELLMTALGRSHQMAVFFDSTGRTYSLPIHQLPSARGQGEPITGRLQLPPQATIVAVIAGEPDEDYLIASDAGYGFITKQSELHSKNKTGKVVLTLPENSRVLLPKRLGNLEDSYIVTVSNLGKMLVFPATELPILAKGKGNKMMQLDPQKAKKREEFLVDTAVVTSQQKLLLLAGKRQTQLSYHDLKHYLGGRGRRGLVLPRGFASLKSIKSID